jgi:isoquinoline 1-oxidoreductase subunit beta
MTTIKTTLGRRAFIQNTSLASGGLVLGFSFLNSCQSLSDGAMEKELPEEWFEINSYLKIGENGLVTILSPNPEGGQNVKTSMPMIVADELDVDWSAVLVEQAPLDTAAFSFQFIGGSQALRRGWSGLRMAGASAKTMLMEAAAELWNVGLDELSTQKGRVYHQNQGKSMGYGELASLAAKRAVPEKVNLKAIADFTIIGNSQKNVETKNIITGKPLFGIDTQRAGMLTAMIVHPPAFGLQLKAITTDRVKSMPGIKDVFIIKVFNDDFEKQFFDTRTFNEVAVIVGDSTWEVLQAKKELQIECAPIKSSTETRSRFGVKWEQHTPAGLENTDDHYRQMEARAQQPAQVRRKDGNPEAAFKRAAKVIESTYTAPFLAHNCMEPMNFFADVKGGKAELIGPLQKPEFTEQTLAARLGIPLENIDIKMSRLGGGYGRRSYAHWLVEAALISQKMEAPVKLVYTREDDMTDGIYRPSYQIKYKAGLDAQGNLIAFHVNAGGIPESPLSENRFPAGAVPNYLAEDWTIDTNITVGSFRAPRSNFMASAEQSFLDEVAAAAGKDPIDFRLELLLNAQTNPVGTNNDYDPKRYAGVLELVKVKSNWGTSTDQKHRGVSSYFCHNTYVAQVLELTVEAGVPVVHKVICGIDCGIVVNPDSAKNMAEGGVVDSIGTALYGELSFENGVPNKDNFHNYRMIRMKEAPKEIDVYFVENQIAPTGLGEPTYPPTFAALANALHKATGKRYYKQPFLS